MVVFVEYIRQALLTGVLLRSSPDLSIRIAVDPSPGCRGIAWPAGQVILSLPLFISLPLRLSLL